MPANVQPTLRRTSSDINLAQKSRVEEVKNGSLEASGIGARQFLPEVADPSVLHLSREDCKREAMLSSRSSSCLNPTVLFPITLGDAIALP